MDDMRPKTSWEFNILNVYNYKKSGPYDFIFEFLKGHQSKFGADILEAGVYRGRMTLALALFLQENSLPGIVHGFDTFSGFPSISMQDENQMFEVLFEDEAISEPHFEQVKRMRYYAENLLDRGLGPGEISSSGSFSDSRYSNFLRKRDFFRLNNIEIHEGNFSETMHSKRAEELQFSLIFIDCDLYEGYVETLNYGWPRLANGGVIFLDEYYSLKFPGARLAVNEFLRDRSDYEMKSIGASDDDFERWVIFKK